MKKKKDVFVWVARDKRYTGWNELNMFFDVRPLISDKNEWLAQSFSGRHKIFSDLSFPDIKEGQCKKFKLVEVKEKGK